MARPIWTGSISFGLLQIPVTLHSGERSIDLHFRLLDRRDKNPIRYERVNSETGEEVPWHDVVKAFEYSKGNYVVVDPDELKEAAPEATQTIDIESFVEADEIDPMYFEKPYYLVPGKRAEKGYVLLREVLRKSRKLGIARVVIRTRQYLAALFAHEDALVLNLLRFPQEIVSTEGLGLPAQSNTKFAAKPRELEMAEALLESMAIKWKPSDYKDEFRTKLRKLLDTRAAKRKGTVHRETPKHAEPEASNVVDFMSLLKDSLAKKGAKAPAKKTTRRQTRARTSKKRA
jgi:DNA end-binding protein Ku